MCSHPIIMGLGNVDTGEVIGAVCVLCGEPVDVAAMLNESMGPEQQTNRNANQNANGIAQQREKAEMN